MIDETISYLSSVPPACVTINKPHLPLQPRIILLLALNAYHNSLSITYFVSALIHHSKSWLEHSPSPSWPHYCPKSLQANLNLPAGLVYLSCMQLSFQQEMSCFLISLKTTQNRNFAQVVLPIPLFLIRITTWYHPCLSPRTHSAVEVPFSLTVL